MFDGYGKLSWKSNDQIMFRFQHTELHIDMNSGELLRGVQASLVTPKERFSYEISVSRTALCFMVEVMARRIVIEQATPFREARDKATLCVVRQLENVTYRQKIVLKGNMIAIVTYLTEFMGRRVRLNPNLASPTPCPRQASLVDPCSLS